jgi:hypothetical protein
MDCCRLIGFQYAWPAGAIVGSPAIRALAVCALSPRDRGAAEAAMMNAMT